MSNKYTKELDFAKELALEAGAVMRRYFLSEDLDLKMKEDDDTPLTIADTTINDLVIEMVKQRFPADGVIGEEASFEINRPRVWVVDPIDGTSPFSLGIPISTFSLGLVDRADGQTIVAAVFEPQLGHLYTSVLGAGAYCNGKRLKVSTATSLSHNYISVIGSVKKQETTIFRDGAAVDLAQGQGAKCFTLISQVYSALKVASGDFVGSIFGYGSAWDSAAVSLIVAEAGGIVTDLEGKQRRFDEFSNGCLLAANETVLSELLRLVKVTTQ